MFLSLWQWLKIQQTGLQGKGKLNNALMHTNKQFTMVSIVILRKF